MSIFSKYSLKMIMSYTYEFINLPLYFLVLLIGQWQPGIPQKLQHNLLQLSVTSYHVCKEQLLPPSGKYPETHKLQMTD